MCFRRKLPNVRAVKHISYATLQKHPLNYLKQRFQSNFNRLLKKTDAPNSSGTKITVAGCGQVGITICSFLLMRNLAKQLVIYDVRHDWAQAEALDLLHGSCFINNPTITACNDGSKTKDSNIVIVTVGARPSGKDRSRLAIVQKTADILKSVMPLLVKQSPNAVFLIISNPADIMTWYVQKMCKLDKFRCFTTGCHLDSARFRYAIAQRMGLPSRSVEGYVIGEHGASAVPVWSTVTVAGVPLMRVVPDIGGSEDKENWTDLFNKGVTKGAAAVSSVKGYTNWAVALAAVDVVSAILNNSGRVMSLGTDVCGLNCIEDHVVLSLPCVVKSNGITHILQLPLTDTEQQQLLKSANMLLEVQCGLKV
ncbi:L-lactate dehydrogenase-like [Scaptodrosophila lebanonensis]|uniref:L-lactate dehydrogenase-like n=1 Tax=Drosophila lebanonensis TaxID=7225 RepID=A0A6J2U312_DROLE|nr:L-lactate dehydrogenase-like [Scaptodrosophila lebanonensis]